MSDSRREVQRDIRDLKMRLEQWLARLEMAASEVEAEITSLREGGDGATHRN